MGVKNGASKGAKVVAGIYGGGNNEYNDDIDGVTLGESKLMMFAGSDGIGNIGKAAFRVYDNGNTYVNNLNARGFFNYEPHVVTDDDFKSLSSYTFKIADISGGCPGKTFFNDTATNVALQLELNSPYIKLDTSSLTKNASIVFPYFNGDDDYFTNIDEVIKFIGKEYIIDCYVYGNKSVYLPVNFGNGDVPNFQCNNTFPYVLDGPGTMLGSAPYNRYLIYAKYVMTADAENRKPKI